MPIIAVTEEIKDDSKKDDSKKLIEVRILAPPKSFFKKTIEFVSFWEKGLYRINSFDSNKRVVESSVRSNRASGAILQAQELALKFNLVEVFSISNSGNRRKIATFGKI
ncbi:MAG: hypothetical protein WCJ57_02080 [Candidatus Falkowbacteria bacterium]